MDIELEKTEKTLCSFKKFIQIYPNTYDIILSFQHTYRLILFAFRSGGWDFPSSWIWGFHKEKDSYTNILAMHFERYKKDIEHKDSDEFIERCNFIMKILKEFRQEMYDYFDLIQNNKELKYKCNLKDITDRFIRMEDQSEEYKKQYREITNEIIIRNTIEARVINVIKNDKYALFLEDLMMISEQSAIRENDKKLLKDDSLNYESWDENVRLLKSYIKEIL
jgi:hypothetical protein